MPRFSYTAYDGNGARGTGVIDCETREAAIEALFRQGRYPLELVEGGRAPAARWWERELFVCARPVAARPGPAHARAGHAGQGRAAGRRGAAHCPPAAADAGAGARRWWHGCSTACSKARRCRRRSKPRAAPFRPTMCTSCVPARPPATLGQSLDDLAGFLERATEFRGRIGSALLYPALLLIVAAAALAVIMIVLIPTRRAPVQGRGCRASLHHSVPARCAGDDRRALAPRNAGRRGAYRRPRSARPQRALAAVARPPAAAAPDRVQPDSERPDRRHVADARQR